MYEVEIELGACRRIRDIAPTSPGRHVHSWQTLADQLHYTERVLTAADRGEIFAAAPLAQDAAGGTAALLAVLARRGIEAFAYRNRYEDPDSTSWIITRPDQARIVGRSTR